MKTILGGCCETRPAHIKAISNDNYHLNISKEIYRNIYIKLLLKLLMKNLNDLTVVIVTYKTAEKIIFENNV